MNINEKSSPPLYYDQELITDLDIDINKKAVWNEKIISSMIDKHVNSLEKEEEDYIKKAIVKKVSKQWGVKSKDIANLDSDTKSVISKIEEIINKKQFVATTKIKNNNVIIVLKYDEEFTMPEQLKNELFKKIYNKVNVKFNYNKSKVNKNNILHIKNIIKNDFKSLLSNFFKEYEKSINKYKTANGVHFHGDIFAEVVDEWYKSSIKFYENKIKKKDPKCKIVLSFELSDKSFTYAWLVLYMNKKSKKEMLESTLMHELGHFFSLSSSKYKKKYIIFRAKIYSLV